MKQQLTETQIKTELELLKRLERSGYTFDRRRVNVEKEPFFVEGFVDDVHVWIYDDGEASVVGRGADLMFEKWDYDSPADLRTAFINELMRLVEI